ncbi:MAG TPA: diguanylate cyclase, partial [Planctomycetota bacterium]|nr:diguanylate cyclase [Planctomycetota bacterium]
SIRRAVRSEQHVSLLLFDLDHFKKLNDTCGHAAGNECLTGVSRLLRSSLRTTDVLARFGGDEFEVLLPDTPPEAAYAVAEKLRQGIVELMAGGDVAVTATFGIAGYPSNAADAQSLFLRADEALYEAKNSGRNRSVLSKHKEPPTTAAGSGLRSASRVPSASRASDSSTSGRRTADRVVTAMELERSIHEQVDGHVLMRRLGTGSNGEVLLVRQPELDRPVALKRPLTPHLTDEQSRNFEREARITASLNHPGVVPVYTMGRDADGRRYFTMKPLEGYSLAFILEARKKDDVAIKRRYTLRRVLEVLQRASEALAYAHEHHVTHLDLSPSNILVGNFGEVTVIDWGKSSTLETRPAASSGIAKTFLVGSPRYLSPEQLPESGLAAGPATDVFALGAMLHEILTGEPPFLRGSLQQTVGALRECELTPPDIAFPNAGIDPSLATLCVNALAKEPALRPSALDFSERLGRYIRKETDWTTVRFTGASSQNEWVPVRGKWKYNDGVWTTSEIQDHTLFWKTSVPGSFRLTCEAWGNENCELSIFGHGVHNDQSYHTGYLFQFGADDGVMTRLHTPKATLDAIPGLAPKARQRYVIELAYDDADGVFECFIDGKLIFHHREIFLVPGDRVGFYAWHDGTNFRPIEIQYDKWSLQIPVIRLADQLYSTGSFEAAYTRYADIAQRVPSRLEGLEARLKSGMCLAKLGKDAEASEVFQSLKGTVMEPVAISEEAMLHLTVRPPNMASAVALFEDMIQRFPAYGRSRVCAAGLYTWQTNVPMAESRVAHHENCIRLQRMVRESFPAPFNAQLISQFGFVRSMADVGRWQELCDEAVQFYAKVTPRQRQSHMTFPVYVIALLGVGRDDLLPGDPYDVLEWHPEPANWASGVVFHIAVRKYGLERLIADFERPTTEKNIRGTRAFGHAIILAYLALGNDAAAKRLLEGRIESKGFPQQPYWYGGAIAEARSDALFDWLMSTYKTEELMRRWALDTIAARYAVEGGDFEGAARRLHNLEQPHVATDFSDATALQAMLSSLGCLKSPTREELEVRIETHLSGTLLELARMFFGKNEPRPGALWPHPHWRPEWRLWLGLWLEARGDRRGAREVVTPAVDPRYLRSHSQPAIEMLLKRLG